MLQTKHSIDEEGRPRPAITSAQGNRQSGIRHISSNHLVSTRVAIRLLLSLESSLQRKQLPAMMETYLKHKFGSVLSSDLCTLLDKISSLSNIDNLLHYLNWHQRAFSIVLAVFEPSVYDIPADLHEYSWDEITSTLVDTSSRQPVLIIEGSSATLAYFAQHPVTRRERRNVPSQPSTTATRFEHNLRSVKKFHRTNHAQLSTFHHDTVKLAITDPCYLKSLQNSINQIRQTYENTRKEVTPNRETLQRILDEIIHTRTQLDKTLLSRQQYIRLRHYIGITRARILRIMDRLQDQKKNQQTRITQYFLQNPRETTVNNSQPTSDTDQSEDYRGESD